MRQHKKSIGTLALSLVFLCETAWAAEIPITNEQSDTPSPERVFGKTQGHWCGTGWQILYGGVGDRRGTPLELTFVPTPSSVPQEVEYTKFAAWEKTINIEIKKRFAALKSIDAGDKLIVAGCDYRISSSGQIDQIKIYGSSSEVFNSMIRTVLASMQGNALLRFPDGCTGTHIRQSGRFVQNYGSKYILGKKETEPNVGPVSN